jgi:2-polyprenyl-3-methyl-5-hydroxy-6-metoxy-1,4-benzoquinol methylase
MQIPDELHKLEIQKKHWQEDKAGRPHPDNPVVIATFNPFASLAASLLEKPENASVLDVGCGNGFLSRALEKRFGEVAGLDYSQEMLKVNPCRNKYLGSSTNLPFSDKSFDVVVAANLLHHLVESDRIKTLFEMIRVARVAVVSFEPNRNNPFMFLFSLWKKEERMVLKFSRSYMRKLFKKIHLKSYTIHVDGWIVPNKSPIWWIPIGQSLVKTPIRKLGFYTCSVGILHS